MGKDERVFVFQQRAIGESSKEFRKKRDKNFLRGHKTRYIKPPHGL